MKHHRRPSRRQIRALDRLVNEAAHERGRASEHRLLEAVRAVGLAYPWYRSARLATQEEDRRGIDIVVVTKKGELYLQAKSSWTKTFTFEARGARIEVVKVSLDDDTNERRARLALERLAGEAATV